MRFHKKKKIETPSDENKIEALYTDQFYEINKNSTIQMVTSQLTQRMSMINTARTSLWASLLTFNSILFAFFYFVSNRPSSPNYISYLLLFTLSITVIIVLYLFLLNRDSNEANLNFERLLENRMRNYLATKKEEKKTKKYTRYEQRCKKKQRRIDFLQNLWNQLLFAQLSFPLRHVSCSLSFLATVKDAQ